MAEAPVSVPLVYARDGNTSTEAIARRLDSSDSTVSLSNTTPLSEVSGDIEDTLSIDAKGTVSRLRPLFEFRRSILS